MANNSNGNIDKFNVESNDINENSKNLNINQIIENNQNNQNNDYKEVSDDITTIEPQNYNSNMDTININEENDDIVNNDTYEDNENSKCMNHKNTIEYDNSGNIDDHVIKENIKSDENKEDVENIKKDINQISDSTCILNNDDKNYEEYNDNMDTKLENRDCINNNNKNDYELVKNLNINKIENYDTPGNDDDDNNNIYQKENNNINTNNHWTHNLIESNENINEDSENTSRNIERGNVYQISSVNPLDEVFDKNIDQFNHNEDNEDNVKNMNQISSNSLKNIDEKNNSNTNENNEYNEISSNLFNRIHMGDNNDNKYSGDDNFYDNHIINNGSKIIEERNVMNTKPENYETSTIFSKNNLMCNDGESNIRNNNTNNTANGISLKTPTEITGNIKTNMPKFNSKTTTPIQNQLRTKTKKSPAEVPSPGKHSKSASPSLKKPCCCDNCCKGCRPR